VSTGRRIRFDWLLVLVALVGIVAVVVVHAGSGSGGATAPSARPLALRFTRAYLRYLDGSEPSAKLPGATASARADVGTRIPRAWHAGRIRATQVRLLAVTGETSATVLFQGSAGSRTVGSSFRMDFRGGRWQVTSVVAPDLVTAFSPRKPLPAASGAARAAARAFATSYIDSLDRSSAQRPADATLGALAGRPLGALPSTRAPARLLSLRLGLPNAGTVDAVARIVVARHRPFTYAFVVGQVRAGWRVTQVIADSVGVSS
jgi:hypothetical protein